MFAQHVYERYGITLPEWLIVEEGKEKVWGFVKEVAAFPERGERRGLIIGRKGKWGYKPTTDFVILFGWMATRNYVNITSRDALKSFLLGKPLPLQGAGKGLKVVLWQGRGVAMGLVSGNLLMPLFPKHRQHYMRGKS